LVNNFQACPLSPYHGSATIRSTIRHADSSKSTLTFVLKLLEVSMRD